MLALVGEGLSNREIAASPYLSPRTVEKHVESLQRNTGIAGSGGPYFEAVLETVGAGPGTHLLDVGCGSAGAAVLAAKRGAL